uniref:Uncharacterized protein n=1 Tax=Eutreptiella gymnastica TaxID=73025 RepID=A0A7S4FQ56_9EUGL
MWHLRIGAHTTSYDDDPIYSPMWVELQHHYFVLDGDDAYLVDYTKYAPQRAMCTQCDDIPHAPLRNVRRGQHACSSSSSARMPCSVAQGWRVGGKVGFLCACTHACPCDHPLFMWALPQWHMPATIPHTDSTMPTISVIC